MAKKFIIGDLDSIKKDSNMPNENANIRVILQPRGNSYENAIDVAMNIDDIVGVVENGPADFHCLVPPGRGLEPCYQVLEHHIGLMKGREGTAKYLAEILTERIMMCLGKDDRIDGFSLDEWKKMHKKSREY